MTPSNWPATRWPGQNLELLLFGNVQIANTSGSQAPVTLDITPAGWAGRTGLSWPGQSLL